jgi:hypothetical protein
LIVITFLASVDSYRPLVAGTILIVPISGAGRYRAQKNIPILKESSPGISNSATVLLGGKEMTMILYRSTI